VLPLPPLPRPLLTIGSTPPRQALRTGQERLEALEAAAKAERQARRASLGLESVEPPDEYRCSITLELMRDPVVVSDGHSYERASIEQVMRGSGLSPRTREVLNPNIIVSNRALRTRIEEHEAEEEEVAQRAQAKLLESGGVARRAGAQPSTDLQTRELRRSTTAGGRR
jgi:hypothetical protein